MVREIDPGRLLFVDEMGANTSLHSLYAWSKSGQRAYCSVPRTRGKNTTLLASMSVEGMGATLAVTGAVNAAVFEAYLEQVLLPCLSPGRIVVIDNLSIHKSERIKALIDAARCEVLYVPSYSPDFNPVEEALSKIKAILRKTEAPTSKVLVEAMGKAISSITAREARAFFGHCGYSLLRQSL